jgi:dihydropyrimidine dehydrogenase (NAD+) subunit PreT
LRSSVRAKNGDFTKLGATLEAERCLLCVNAPCATACPAGTEPDKFIRQLRFENELGGAETILDNNALGGMCGAVCPVSRLCEGACTRKSVDEPVKIGAIQKYLHNVGIEQGISLPPVPPPTGHKVAVIGAGPSGLSCARELLRRGSAVTIFEKHADTGGALRYALSPVRVSHDSVTEEVDRIKAMGAVFQFNTEVADIKDLYALGKFDDVYISPGLQASRQVKIATSEETTSAGLAKVTTALDFLYGANADAASEHHRASTSTCMGQSVVVIGGGSVAMDCAITAIELGATRVYAVSLESLDSLPADEDEIRLARERGVIFLPEMRIARIVTTDNIVAVQIRKTDNGKIEDQADAESHLLASAVIVAAGQVLDVNGKQLLSLEGHPDHVLVNTAKASELAAEMLSTASSSSGQYVKVYAGGDAVRGAGDTVVQAVADGKRAASLMLPTTPVAPRQEISLRTEFCGVVFENPFCLSSSPVSNSAEMIATAFEAGWGGAYYKTLNREDKFRISHPSPRLGSVHAAVGSRMGVGIQNVEQISDRPLADNLADILWLRKNYPDKVNGVSIMGYDEEDWAYLAAAAEVRLLVVSTCIT